MPFNRFGMEFGSSGIDAGRRVFPFGFHFAAGLHMPRASASYYGLVFIYALSMGLFSSFALATAADADAEWTPLFNGKDLTGWYSVLSGRERNEDPDRLIQIHDGMIHLYKDAPDKTAQSFGYIATENVFSNYRARVQYKWGKKQFAPREKGLRDAGFLYHVFGKDKERGVWPLCVECQIQEGNSGDLIPVGTKCTTWVSKETQHEKYPKYQNSKAGGIAYSAEGYIYADKVLDSLDDWNTVEIVVNGSQNSVHLVNGQENHSAQNLLRRDGDKWVPLKKGHLALQLEGAEVFYRKIEIQSLEPDSKLLSDGKEPASASEKND
jgi:Domain of Unknown Function (DUF1080)